MASHAEHGGMEEFDGLSREELISIVLELREAILTLQRENEDLRSKLNPGGGGAARQVPEWVRPNRKERRAAERKNRKQSFVRKRELPSRSG